jgi:hypothetical protein
MWYAPVQNLRFFFYLKFDANPMHPQNRLYAGRVKMPAPTL